MTSQPAAIDSLRAMNIITDFLRGHLKARTLIVKGDTSHFSIACIIGLMWKNIDQPRRWDFQAETVNEDDFFAQITRFTDNLFGVDIDAEKAAAVIAGEDYLVIPGQWGYDCHECKARLYLYIKGNLVVFVAEPNVLCGQHRFYTIDVDFPTGEVVFADWPDRFTDMEKLVEEADKNGEPSPFWKTRNHDVNTLKGTHESSLAMAEQNILHMFVGNTCPGLYYNPTNSAIHIGSTVDYDDETDEETPLPEFAGFVQLGSFCTDLWWVTMVDRQYYDAMVAKLPERTPSTYVKKVTVAKVKPGRYRFTSCYGMDPTDDPDRTITYAKAEYIGPCE